MKKCKCIKNYYYQNTLQHSKGYNYEYEIVDGTPEIKINEGEYTVIDFKHQSNDNYTYFEKYFIDIQKQRKQKLLNITRNTIDEKS